MKTAILNTWSPLSNATVRLKPSRDYLRLLVVVHGLAVLALCQSACPMGLIVVLTFVLAAHGSYAWRRETPGARCSELHYTKERWLLLDDVTGELVAYTNGRIRFDFGWLMWLVFENKSALKKPRRRDVFVFQDQITPDEHRLLRLILRVNYKKLSKL